MEYKPFEPAFYHTDLADWGMALLTCRRLGEQREGARGPRATTCPGHEHRADRRVAAGREGWLGGFHFNNRKYADDDLIVGSINPYELFLIFDELAPPSERGRRAGIALHDRPVATTWSRRSRR